MIGYANLIRSRIWITVFIFSTLGFLISSLIYPKMSQGYRDNNSHWILWSQNPDRDYNDLKDLEFLDADNGWAVGVNGTILYWDGSVWFEVTSPVTQTLNAIDMYSSSDGWIVGENKTLLHWDGYVWNLVDPGIISFNKNNADAIFLDIDMISPDQIWVVGMSNAQAIIIYYDGYRWRNWESPLDQSLTSVDMLTDDNGWSTGMKGYIIKKILGDWIGTTSPTEYDLYDVINCSNDEGWAVGGNGTILHRLWNEWHETVSPTIHTLKSISMLNPDNLWAVGDSGTILNWDGSMWSVENTSFSHNLNAIFMISDDSGWIAGDTGILLRYWTGDLYWSYLPITRNDN